MTDSERRLAMVMWLAEWRDDVLLLVEQLPNVDTRDALYGELAELAERLDEELLPTGGGGAR